MITYQEELSALIDDSAVPSNGAYVIRADLAAEAVVAAGYIKPRVITTDEEREQLPNSSVVRSDAGSIANIQDGKAYFFGFEHPVDAKMLALPITILWEVTP